MFVTTLAAISGYSSFCFLHGSGVGMSGVPGASGTREACRFPSGDVLWLFPQTGRSHENLEHKNAGNTKRGNALGARTAAQTKEPTEEQIKYEKECQNRQI